MRDICDPRKWSEIVADAVVVTDDDRVRRNTRDDFDLGPGWVFAGGKYLEVDGARTWTMLFVQLTTNFRTDVRPHVIEAVGSIAPVRWQDGTWQVFVESVTHIGSQKVELVNGPPAQFQQFWV